MAIGDVTVLSSQEQHNRMTSNLALALIYFFKVRSMVNYQE